MDRATHGRPFWALRPGSVGGVTAAMFAIAIFTNTTTTTKAVEPLQAAAAVEAPVAGNGPTGYFPDQFVNEASEVTAHIEAF